MTWLSRRDRSAVTIGTIVVSAGLIALVAELPPIPASVQLSPVSAGITTRTPAAGPSPMSESTAAALHAQVPASPLRTHRAVLPQSIPSVSPTPDLHPSASPPGSGHVRTPAASSSPSRSPSPHASPRSPHATPSASATPSPHPHASPSPTPDPTPSPSPSTSESPDG